MKSITSRQNPIVARFRALADSGDPSGARMLLDGVHLVREALDAGLPFEAVAASASQLASATQVREVVEALQEQGVEVIKVPDGVFSALSPVRTPTGLVAIALRQPVSITQICESPDALVLVAVDIQDPGNVGALARTAEAGGCTGMLVTGSSANPFSWKAVRGSMGSALRLPLATGVPTEAVLSHLRGARIRSLAAVARSGTPADEVDWRGNVAIVLGNEGSGLPDSVIEKCDMRVSIPMAPQVESLNVSAAGAILVYAARRARQ